MEVKVLKEAGLEEALLGLSLSYNSEPSIRVANKLAWKQGGHNKFLEALTVWIDIKAPLYWWKHFDTYRVGTSKQSESTMHTILRRELTQEDFESNVHIRVLYEINSLIKVKRFEEVNNLLPQGFLQRRIVTTNYKVLQNMVAQRSGHKLPEWIQFIEELGEQLEYPKWVIGDKD